MRDSTRGVLNGQQDLWELLENDPLCELQLLAAQGGAELAPNAPAPGQRLAAAARRLDLAGHPVLAPDVQDAVDHVLAHARFTTSDDVLRPALARALVAETLRRAEDRLGQVPVDGARLDEVLAAVLAGLGDSERAPGSVLAGFVARSGLSRLIERRRHVLTSSVAPLAGDVLVYLTRGGPVREFIEQAVLAAEPPAVLVAHSLGGIASLELLVSRALPGVELLVTVGSQAPLLYELNALPCLEFGAPLPEWMPRWVNVYDQRDLLAFVGEKLFPAGVTDRRVDNRIGFPRSHSAYVANKGFYQVLDEVLP
ncbi:hypothetical protein [Lentzea sp. CA-135723]|uniref:hypothetical protein n=1 Tax=Lentzea sp. CA-135723 TaxID=3239950 RepID=UPI003D8DBF91